MSTNIKYGVLDANKFTRVPFIYEKGSEKLQILKGQDIGCQLYDTWNTNSNKFVSFDFDDGSKQDQAPITKRWYSNDLLGYLAIDWKNSNVKEKRYSLKMVLVTNQKIKAHGYIVGSVKINDLFDCFSSSSLTENKRIDGKDGHIISQPGLNPGQGQRKVGNPTFEFGQVVLQLGANKAVQAQIVIPQTIHS